MRLLLKIATSRPRGKGVTSIASSAIRLDELLDVYRERVSICVMAGEKVLMFFPAKNLRNAPREVVACGLALRQKGMLNIGNGVCYMSPF